ncbi:DNA-3-methyladenine glycosylase I [Ferrimonas balearica]|uniref:DNA-3-methyladenine glycosylase I n=1 Tax=Ferrimonas balearica TaxID=44012 RepID=UPI001C99E4DF|nr:DNA-3-methyladenine glycosylase I [Ferrimonas balearica]MBY5923478.1 DNA-3-methyladenine glycosylase I [Ferrimonas balearica]MBY5997857.1 DNA-3-methyladenine glycosylase I [Ferrimonas balearica]
MSEGRCSWCGDDRQYVAYHDNQWGRPVRDKYELFEKLCLDGQQAGLSWLIILRKTESYRAAFDGFDPAKIALYDDARVELLLQNPGIVRNRLKVNSIIKNARAFLAMEAEGIDFADFLWGFVGHQTIVNRWESTGELPATSVESDAMSKALKKAGFNFVGSTICYAFMQAVGMVNDHMVTCPQYRICQQESDGRRE